jgi:hypothetical protein
MNKMNNAPQIVGRVTLPAPQEPTLLGVQPGKKQVDKSESKANLSWEVTFVKPVVEA